MLKTWLTFSSMEEFTQWHKQALSTYNALALEPPVTELTYPYVGSDGQHVATTIGGLPPAFAAGAQLHAWEELSRDLWPNPSADDVRM